jgi:preprotein translocase subunit SecE
MANTAAAAGNEGFGGIKSWPARIKSFYSDVRTEMRKVTAPGRKEVQTTTIVVIITVFLFAAYFWMVDNTLGRAVTALIQYLSGH